MSSVQEDVTLLATMEAQDDASQVIAEVRQGFEDVGSAINTLGAESTTAGTDGAASMGILGDSLDALREVGALALDVLGQVTALAAVVGTGLVDMYDQVTKGAQEYAQQLTTVEFLTGETSTKSAALIAGFEGVGISTNGAVSMLTRLAANLGSLSTAQDANGKISKSQALEMRQLGISFTNAHGGMLPMSDLLPVIIDHLKNMTNVSERDTLARKLFGRSFADVAPLILAGGQAFKQAELDAKGFGNNLSQDQVQALMSWKTAQEKATEAVAGFTGEMALQALPVLMAIKEIVQDLGRAYAGLTPGTREAIQNTLGLVAIFGPLLGGTKAITMALTTLKEMFPVFGKALLDVAAPFLAILGPILLLVAAVLALKLAYDHIAAAHERLQPVVTALNNAFAIIKVTAQILVGIIQSLGSTFGGSIQTEAKNLLTLLAGELTGAIQAVSGAFLKLNAFLVAHRSEIIAVARQVEAFASGAATALGGTLMTVLTTMAAIFSAAFSAIGSAIVAVTQFLIAHRGEIEAVVRVVIGFVSGALAMLRDALGGVLGFMKDNMPAIIGFVGTLVGIWVGFNTVLLATRAIGFATMVVEWIARLIAWTSAAGLAATAQSVLNVVMSANPIGIVVIALAALVAGFILAYQHIAPFHEAVDRVGTFLKGLGEEILPMLRAAWDGLQPSLKEIGDSFKQIWDALQPAKPILDAVLGALGAMLAAAGAIILVLLGGTFKGLLEFLVHALPTAIDFVVGVIRVFADGFKLMADVISGVITIVGDLLSGNWSKAWTDAQKLVGTVIHDIGQILLDGWQTIVNLIQGVIVSIGSGIKGFVEGIVGTFQWLMDKLVGHSIIPDMINAIVGWFTGLPGRVLSILTGFVRDIVSTIATLAAPLIQGFTVVATALMPLKPLFETIFTAFIGVLSAVGQAILGLVGGALKALVTLFTSLIPVAIRATLDVVAVFHSTLKLVGDVVGGVVRIVSDLLKGNWHQAWTDAQALFQTVVADIQGILNGFKTLFTNLIQGLVTSIGATLKSFVGSAVATFVSLRDHIGAAVSGLVGDAVKWFQGLPGRVLGVLTGFVRDVISTVTTLAAPLLQMFAVVAAAVMPLKPLFEVVFAAFITVLGAVGQAILSLIGGAFKALVTFFTDMIPVAIRAALNVVAIFQSTFKLVGDVTSGVVKIVSDLLKGNWHQAWTDAQALFRTVVADIQNVMSGFKNLFTNLIHGLVTSVSASLTGFVGSAVATFINLRTRIVAAVGPLITDVVKWFQELPGKVLGILNGMAARAVAAAAGLGRAIVSGLGAGLSGLEGVLKHALKAMLGSIPFGGGAAAINILGLQGFATGTLAGPSYGGPKAGVFGEGGQDEVVATMTQVMRAGALAAGTGGGNNGPQVTMVNLYLDGKLIQRQVMKGAANDFRLRGGAMGSNA